MAKFLLKTLLFAYILTGGLLMLLALLVYRLQFAEKTVNLLIILVYILATFFSGFLAGRKTQNKKYLWGLLMGTAYFVVLLLVSLLVNKSVGDVARDVTTTLVICAGSGMLGGMLG